MDSYSVLLRWSHEDGEWVAEVPELPGLSFLAPTRDSAATGVSELIEQWQAALGEAGRDLPAPNTAELQAGPGRPR